MANFDVFERIVRALVVGLMNGMLYFTDHRRVVESCEDAFVGFGEYLNANERLILGLREGLLIFEGKPRYDLSLYAHRLIQALKEHQASGIQFERGITVDDIHRLIKVLLDGSIGTAAAGNEKLEGKGQQRISLLDALPDSEGDNDGDGEHGKLSIDDQELSREAYSGALSALQDVMVEMRRDHKASLSRLSDAAAGIAVGMHKNRIPFVALTTAKEYDTFTFNHSVNVCIHATSLAETLVRDQGELVQIAQAALLHDIGKILIAEEILYKPGKLTDGEWRVMRQHPLLGAKILMAAGGVSDLALNVAYGHHLRYDRKGYPEAAVEMTVDPVTELINVIDVYEAVTAVRPYKQPFPPENAAELLLKGSGTEFNPICVDALLRFVGVFPVGYRVGMDDGSVGQVVEPNPADPLRPRVRLFLDPHGQPLEPKQVVNTAEKNAEGGYVRSIVKTMVAAEAVVPASARP